MARRRPGHAVRRSAAHTRELGEDAQRRARTGRAIELFSLRSRLARRSAGAEARPGALDTDPGSAGPGTVERATAHPRPARRRAATCEASSDLEALALRAHPPKRDPRLRQARRHALLRARARTRLAPRRSDHHQVGGARWHGDRSSNAPAATTQSSTTSTASRDGRRSAQAAATPNAPSRPASARSTSAPGASRAARHSPPTPNGGSRIEIPVVPSTARGLDLHLRRTRTTGSSCGSTCSLASGVGPSLRSEPRTSIA